MAFIAMRLVGVGADIMSLGGIAIAIGAMIDAAIVMIENMHKHLERAVAAKAGDDAGDGAVRSTSRELTTAERWQVVVEASKEVGPALFFSLLIITVSFLPVFTLEGQEGRLFKPLAFTKTFAMAAASLLSVTLVPVTMGLFIRGRIYPRAREPAQSRAHPAVPAGDRLRAARIVARSIAGGDRDAHPHVDPVDADRQRVHAAARRGHDPLHADDAARESASRARARCFAQQDSILKSFPEVEHVWGKAGRANTATDPAGLDMFETTITLKPRSAVAARA